MHGAVPGFRSCGVRVTKLSLPHLASNQFDLDRIQDTAAKGQSWPAAPCQLTNDEGVKFRRVAQSAPKRARSYGLLPRPVRAIASPLALACSPQSRAAQPAVSSKDRVPFN